MCGDDEKKDLMYMPEPFGKPLMISSFVDEDCAVDVLTRRLHTGILIFVNNALIMGYRKRQNIVESSTYQSELVMMRLIRDSIAALRTKLKMFCMPLLGPAN